MMRLDKFLSNLKYGTRKEVTKFIKSGNVSVNQKMIKDASTNIDEDKDIIMIGDETVFYRKNITLMLNKPKNVVSANHDSLHDTVIDLLEDPFFRFDFNIAGRLDIDTTGFVLLTTDGELLHKVISPTNHIYKTYVATLKEPANHLELLTEGVRIKDSTDQEFLTKPAIVEQIDEYTVQIKIEEGKFHQVKRMFEAIHNEVVELKRTAIGGLCLDEALEERKYTFLSDGDIAKIFQ